MSLLIKKLKKERSMNKSFFFLLLLVFFNSCGIKKTATDFSSPPKNSEELIERIIQKNKTPEFLNLKGRAEVINKNQKTVLNLSIKNRKDSVIWISGTGPFGVEIIRAQLTPDSISFLNRINKTYFKKPISKINEFIKSDVSFYDVQGIITANPKIVKKNYKLELTDAGFYLISDKFTHFINSNYKIQNTQSNYNFSGLQFSFSNYSRADNFPRKLTLKIQGEEAFEISINFSRVEFKKSKNMMFKIPKSYHEIK